MLAVGSHEQRVAQDRDADAEVSLRDAVAGGELGDVRRGTRAIATREFIPDGPSP